LASTEIGTLPEMVFEFIGLVEDFLTLLWRFSVLKPAFIGSGDYCCLRGA